MKANKYKMTLRIYSESPKLIESLCASLRPEESSQADEKRGKVSIDCDFKKEFIELIIESNSDGGFRALLNSYLYLLKVFFDSIGKTAVSISESTNSQQTS
ncbi:MAG: KEOPS complex subunit Pcc1 [Desulfurococcales archaeon]